jgi:hypothetical protein
MAALIRVTPDLPAILAAHVTVPVREWASEGAAQQYPKLNLQPAGPLAGSTTKPPGKLGGFFLGRDFAAQIPVTFHHWRRNGVLSDFEAD